MALRRRIPLSRLLVWVAGLALTFDLARLAIRREEPDGFTKLLAILAFHAACVRAIARSFPAAPPPAPNQ